MTRRGRDVGWVIRTVEPTQDTKRRPTLNASSPTRALTDDELDTYLHRAGPVTGH